METIAKFLKLIWSVIFNIYAGVWAKLFTLLMFAIPWIISSGLKYLGVGLISYYGFGLLIDQLESFIFSSYDNLPADLFAILTIAGFDDLIAIIFASYVLLFTHKAMSAMKVSNSNTLAA